MGSVFSPTYFAARARDPNAPAEDFCAVNAVVYNAGARRWAFTEPGPGRFERTADRFALSGSAVTRQGDSLVFELDERAAPLGGRIRGRVRLDLQYGAPAPYALDAAGRHQWWPVGASSRAAVELDEPELRFSGSAYHDCNFGNRPLEDDFDGWDWSRTAHGDETRIHYDVRGRDGFAQDLALSVGPRGVEALQPEAPFDLPPPRWGMPRSVRGVHGGELQAVQALEVSPFYTRTALEHTLDGHRVHTMHESLSMTQFVKPWVRTLLPFRMRRGWRA